MSKQGKKDGLAVIGVGAAACAACCAVPIIGFLAAVFAGATVLSFIAVGGVAAMVVAGVGVAVLAWRRRQSTSGCGPVQTIDVSVDLVSKHR